MTLWAPLLLADPSPSLRLLVLRELLNRPESDPEVLSRRRDISFYMSN